MEENISSYNETWIKLKRNQRILITIVVLFFPALYLAIRPLYQLYDKDWIITGYALGWLFIFLFYVFKVTFFRCPRCGHMFSTDSYYLGMKIFGFKSLRSKYFKPYECVHCKLQKWTGMKDNEKTNGA